MDFNLAATSRVPAIAFVIAIARAIAMTNVKRRAATKAAVDRVKQEREQDNSLPRRTARPAGESPSIFKRIFEAIASIEHKISGTDPRNGPVQVISLSAQATNLAAWRQHKIQLSDTMNRMSVFVFRRSAPRQILLQMISSTISRTILCPSRTACECERAIFSQSTHII
ncbi:hypothetical protein L2Y90_31295 (plasmid) [Burkholderia pyrrocinia]|uniref:hypothetical protein n=1 Tax=Burkholderia pyrrocinia TaxID=60550 RepID=UPI00215B0D4A|nr:hypothetical protein [Burkholderia pyrrocinia]UVE70316.1 hypothetical protein L2Y90_31295 [Burkholderia pyrrocinia]